MTVLAIPREGWRPFVPRGAEQRAISATLVCPGCGKWCSLGPRHVVADDGAVTPSVVCPHPPCSFHQYIRLDGWAQRP